MAEEATKDLAVREDSGPEKKDSNTTNKKKRKGILSRIWNMLFRSHGDDFEKRLKYISKEEASVLNRLKKRSLNTRRMAKNLIIFSVFFEVIAVGYAIMTTRSLDMNWKMRAFRVLPMFLLPGLSFAIYSGMTSYMRMRDRKDQKTLEKLRAERQAKIDELKERSNYYVTQQLIQRYDPDPAAKAAAATVLASKLGADSGLKVNFGDDTSLNSSTTKSNDVELVKSSGMRNRKQAQAHTRSSSAAATTLTQQSQPNGEISHEAGSVGSGASHINQTVVVEHYQHDGLATHDGGWISRIAALLVGEDPTQSYALICGNCHMHNGLARKEDYPYITYYCPHCRALNKSKQIQDHLIGTSSSNTTTVINTDLPNREITFANDIMPVENNPTSPKSETEDATEAAVPPADPAN